MGTYLNISVDAEAQPARADGKPLETLIWGRFDGEEYGIGRIMAMADRHGFKLTIYLDYCEFFLYGEQLLDVAKEIQRRGHDVQMHLHTDLLPAEMGTAFGASWKRSLNTFHQDAAKPFAAFFAELAERATGRPAVAFRGGAFRFSPAIIEALHDVGLKLSSNYHSRAKYWAADRPLAKCFRWPNGSTELPLSGALMEGGGRKYFIFEDFPVENDASLTEFVKSFDTLPGGPSILTHVLHSWSLLDKDEQGRFVRPSDKKIARLDAFFANLKNKELQVVTTEEVLRITADSKLPTVEYDSVFQEPVDPPARKTAIEASSERRGLQDLALAPRSKVKAALPDVDPDSAPAQELCSSETRVPEWARGAISWLSEPRSAEDEAQRQRVFRQAKDLTRDKYLAEELKTSVPSGSRRALEALLEGRLLVSQSEGTTVPISTFEWKAPGLENRANLWLVQQLYLVRDCATERATSGTAEGIHVASPLVRRWAEANVTAESLRAVEHLAWHDHTTALRSIHIVYFLFMLAEAGASLEEEFPRLFEFLNVHLRILSAEDFYQRGTNHGFDQAFALYLLAKVFDLGELTRKAAELGRSRLTYEIGVAFTEEGVHVENSPGYHVLMIARLAQAERLLSHFDGSELDLGIGETIEKAVDFLAYAIRPDGFLPMLGDTEMTRVPSIFNEAMAPKSAKLLRYTITSGAEGEQPPFLAKFFPKAGYAFLRDRWAEGADATEIVHVTLKCGFLSNYHRHDDDNNLLLYAFGEDWLIDSGIFKYHEQDPHRIYLRSSLAHNIVSIAGVEASRRIPQPSESIGIRSWRTAGTVTEVRAISQMYEGFNYERIVTFDRATRTIELIDRIAPSEKRDSSYELRFHVPRDKRVDVVSHDSVEIHGSASDRILRIEVEEGVFTPVEVGASQVAPTMAGWTSPVQGTLEGAQTILFRSSGPTLHSRARLSFRRRAEGTMKTADEGAATKPQSEGERSATPAGPQSYSSGSATLTVEPAVGDKLPKEAYFLEHVFDNSAREATTQVVAAYGHSVFQSDDLGQTWQAFDLSAAIGQREVRRSFTLANGNRLLQCSSPRTDGRVDTILVDPRWKVVKFCEAGGYNWHGTWSIDQAATGVIMYGEYCDSEMQLSLWRSIDLGRSWQPVLTFPSTESPTPEIRHFHVCQADPERTGRWLASSGDSAEHCKIWTSEDDGTTWTEAGEPTIANDFGLRISKPRRGYRFTSMAFEADTIVWPTDDNLGTGRATLIAADKADPSRLRICGQLGINEMRAFVRLGEGVGVAISESKFDQTAADVFLFDPKNGVTELAKVPNLSGGKAGFTRSIASKAARDGVFFSYDDRGVVRQGCRFVRWTAVIGDAASESSPTTANADAGDTGNPQSVVTLTSSFADTAEPPSAQDSAASVVPPKQGPKEQAGEATRQSSENPAADEANARVAVISYREPGLPEIRLRLPIDWSANVAGNLLWAHDFLTLRWIFRATIAGIGTQEQVAAVLLADFLRYHRDPMNGVSQYYTNRASDHTAAERLLVFSRALSECQQYLSGDFPANLFREEIAYTIRLLSSDVIYRERTNHGLQMDLAVLRFMEANPPVDEQYAKICRARATETVDGVFDAAGITLEHSVSYQEYNLNLCASILDALSENRKNKKLRSLARACIEGGSEMLLWAQKPNAEYSTLGDTFRFPDRERVKRIAKWTSVGGDLLDALVKKQPRTTEGVRVYPGGGFGFARVVTAFGPVHLGFTSGFHSGIHKEDDDTSFTLFASECDVIDDAGYCHLLVNQEAGRRVIHSSRNHSVLQVGERKWGGEAGLGLSRITGHIDEQGIVGFSGRHQRIPGLMVERFLILLKGAALVIYDRTDLAVDENLTQTFVFGPDIVAVPVGLSLNLSTRGGQHTGTLRPLTDGANATLSEVDVVRDSQIAARPAGRVSAVGRVICSVVELKNTEDLSVASIIDKGNATFEIGYVRHGAHEAYTVAFKPVG